MEPETDVGDTEQLTDQLATDLDDGFTELVRVYVTAVRNFLLRLSGSGAEADDLVQETFLRAYSALQDYSPDRRRSLRPRAWLMTIAANVWRNYVRASSRHPVSLTGEGDELARWLDDRPGPSEQAENALDREVLVAALTQLPERYRMAVVLRHVVGMSYEEAAEVMGAPVGTVKAQVSRGLASLRGHLDPRMATVWG
jgi:RNA polymerase sigma-70 factor (ECF subfamily)